VLLRYRLITWVGISAVEACNGYGVMLQAADEGMAFLQLNGLLLEQKPEVFPFIDAIHCIESFPIKRVEQRLEELIAKVHHETRTLL
jgi:hypothetical protein